MAETNYDSLVVINDWLLTKCADLLGHNEIVERRRQLQLRRKLLWQFEALKMTQRWVIFHVIVLFVD